LKNAKEAIKEFEDKYWRNKEDINWQEKEKRIYKREKLPGRFMAKKLFG